MRICLPLTDGQSAAYNRKGMLEGEKEYEFVSRGVESLNASHSKVGQKDSEEEHEGQYVNLIVRKARQKMLFNVRSDTYLSTAIVQSKCRSGEKQRSCTELKKRRKGLMRQH